MNEPWNPIYLRQVSGRTVLTVRGTLLQVITKVYSDQVQVEQGSLLSKRSLFSKDQIVKTSKNFLI